MAEPKNIFNFGTGDIDKDQWLRDIDSELEDFISKYGMATNKHRTTLLRQAFQDLRTRIANGDMLNRTADGRYQFGSMLNRDDKHMQEAYERALGFMGGLARRQITAPPAEPEKKALGSLEERYIKSLNPSGKFNTEAYWKNQTDEERRTALKNFLNRELKEAENYQDFGNFGDRDTYTQRLRNVMTLLESGKANDWSLQLLGFTKNWLQQPTNLEETETPKSELEQVQADIAAAQEAQQVAQGRLYLSYNANRGTTNFDLSIPTYDFNKALLNYLSSALSDTQLHLAAAFNPNFNPNSAKAEQAKKYIALQLLNLNNYFINFATSWRPNYESGLNNRDTMLNYLSRLFATYNKGTNADGTPITDYVYNWNKYFTLIGDNQFLINGSLDKTTGRYAYYVPGQGIRESNILDTSNPYIAQQLGYTIPSLKEGGKVEFLQSGGGFDYDAWAASQEKPKAQVISKPLQASTTKLENNYFSKAENARIAATIADIASMGAAFVPGYGTATSAILGLGSTATNFGADLADGQGLWNATKNAGFGLAADVMGLIPGLGGAGKGAKIARNLMWVVPKMMQWVNTYLGLQNAGEIKNSIMKLTSPSSMTVQDWLNVSQALQIMTGHGRSIATKVKKAGMSKTTTTTEPEYYIYTNKGKQKVSDETFKKLRETRGTKARQDLTQELMGEGVILLQSRFAPWNTSTRFGAFKEVPGQTKVEIQNKHKGLLSDENLVEKTENLNPSVDIRGILHRINPYRNYYVNRNLPVIPLKNYSNLEANTLAENLPLRAQGPLLPLPDGAKYKNKTKPLTEELKLRRREAAALRKLKKQESAAKLEALRQLQELARSRAAMLTDIPTPEMSTYSVMAEARRRSQESLRMNSRWALEEIPDNFPPQVLAFYNRYHTLPLRHKLGGVLKALRNGGIIKAKWGDDTSDWMTPLYNPEKQEEKAIYTNPYFPNIKYNGTAPWYKSRFSGESVINLGNDASGRANLPGGLTGNNLDYAFARNQAYVKSGQLNKLADILGYFDSLPSPIDANDLQGLTDIYNKAIDELYLPFTSGKNVPDYLKTDATKHNLLFKLVYGSRARVNGGDDNYDIGWNPDIIKTFGSASFARRPVNYETKWEDDLKNNLTLAKDRVSKISHNGIEGYVYTDENGRIHPLTNDLLKLINGQLSPQKLNKEKEEGAADSATERKTVPVPEYKNAFDPSLLISAAKYFAGLRGNRDIYQNLLDEMPEAPLRDPLDRKLAIVGWQERIKSGLNQLADLRRIQLMQQGSDQLANFATALDTERTGRDIMDKAFAEDSGRQFETALKSWNLDNEDILYNTGVGDANRKSIADRQRMMTQIRAAWRSGDQNLKMGLLADAGNWFMKRYQREQDMIDKARELSLGTPEEWAQSEYTSRLGELANKKSSDLTEPERAKVEAIRAQVMQEMRLKYSEKYYNLYHTPGFGGGYGYALLSKNGSKLEVAKLKARGKDNDRYVSMIKDLRKRRKR